MMRFLVFFAAGWVGTVSLFAAPAAPSYSPHSLAVEVRRIAADWRAQPADLPDSWEVRTAEGRYTISSEPLRGRDLEPEKAKAWLEETAANLDAYATAEEPEPEARTKLTRILARSEFQSIPPAADGWRQKIGAWIGQLFMRLFQFVDRHPSSGELFIWVIAAAGIGFLGLTLFRLGSRAGARLVLTARTPPSRARSWEQWLAEARAAAANGNARMAIHLAYWAGIARLQEGRALPLDLTRTPREYVRLLSASHSEFLGPLAGLTQDLERFWYAGRMAGTADFEQSLLRLEALGCRPE
jgi:hypothetical protein